MMNESYTNEQIQVAEWCKALAHPARVAIVQHLLTREDCVCGDIVDQLPLSQSTVSQHLKELKKAGLIQGRVSGPSVCYCLHAENWIAFSSKLTPLFTDILTSNECC